MLEGCDSCHFKASLKHIFLFFFFRPVCFPAPTVLERLGIPSHQQRRPYGFPPIFESVIFYFVFYHYNNLTVFHCRWHPPVVLRYAAAGRSLTSSSLCFYELPLWQFEDLISASDISFTLISGQFSNREPDCVARPLNIHGVFDIQMVIKHCTDRSQNSAVNGNVWCR